MKLFKVAVLFLAVVVMAVSIGCSKKNNGGGGINDTGIPGVPFILSLNPDSGYCGQNVTIGGRDFGDTPGEVIFSIGVNAAVIQWSDAEIQCTIPMGALPGPVYVVDNKSQKSNEPFFNVTGSGGTGGMDPGSTATGVQPSGGGRYDKYKLYIPTSYDPSTPMPLMTLNDTHHQWTTIFAGTTGRGWTYMAEELKFIVAAWDLTNTTGEPKDAQCEAILSGIEDMKKLYNIDVKRVYFSGCCRFARMVTKWAILRPDYFAAGHIDSCTGELDSNVHNWTGRKPPVYIVEPSGHMPNNAVEVKNALESLDWEVVLKGCSMSKPGYEEAMMESMVWILQKENPTPGGGMP
jgi:hypothetical protein